MPGHILALDQGTTSSRAIVFDDQGQPLTDPWPTLRGIRRTVLPSGPLTIPVRAPTEQLAAPTRPAAPNRGHAPEPTPLEPGFTEGDFDGQPRLAALLDRCPVLAEVVRRGLEDGTLDRNSAIVLQHTMGHLPEGVAAVNYLVDRCGAPAEQRMGKPHRGSPSSCARIRRRIPSVAGRVPCACDLSHARSYPSPIRHVEHLPPPQPTPLAVDGAPTEQVVDALASLMQRQQRLDAELRATRRLATERLAELPEGTLATPTGLWKVGSDDGLPTLHFEPAASEAS